MKPHGKKCFALIGIILFIGLAVAPSVNAGIFKDAIERRIKDRNINLLKNNEYTRFNQEELPKSQSNIRTVLIFILTIIANSSYKLYKLIKTFSHDCAIFLSDLGLLAAILLLPLWFPMSLILGIFLRNFLRISKVATFLIEILSIITTESLSYKNHIKAITLITKSNHKR
jgi:Na+/glutamate symporter